MDGKFLSSPLLSMVEKEIEMDIDIFFSIFVLPRLKENIESQGMQGELLCISLQLKLSSGVYD